ncbi:MAG: M48 family metallopeptidase [Proteobacteria bacterium]|nr:M48 family metallopeptidase [Pseudomonadota bacterium]
MTARPPATSHRLQRTLSRVLAMAVAGATFAGDLAHAQRAPAGLPLIRDAEIEQLLREYTRPILRVAGLAKQNVHIIIINNRAFNAFVMDGRRIFVNAGALIDAQTPNQIIGVLAHETGHIAGGHLAKLRQELVGAQTAAILAAVLGLGLAVAGSRYGGASAGQIGAAALSAPQSIIQRTLLSYVRAQEDAADRAAVKFLNATNQSSKGMFETFKRFYDQTLFQSPYTDPYLQSHPMPVERIAALQEVAKTSPFWEKRDSAELQARHDLMRAKLYGFIERADAIARRYPASDASLAARYARAISTYRHGDLRHAHALIDGLIQAQPNYPYFHELKGQVLLESGHPANAIAPLRRAIALAPEPTLIQVMLAQALIATNDPKRADEAIANLRAAMTRDDDIPEGYAQLAMAYGRKGDLAQADLASARAAFGRGDYPTARQLAMRAKTRFPTGSPGWVKADDLSSYKPPKPAYGRN